MLRTFQRSLLAAAGLAMALSSCSAGPLADRMPESLGGLPAGAPARPTTSDQYPAVHDMPPPRSTTTMSEEEQFKLEKELAAARDRQETQEGQADQAAKEGPKGQAGAAKKSAPATDKKAAPLTKKQPSNAILVPPAGVKTNP